MHCGQVKNGGFQDGRQVSVNRVAKLLKLTNQKSLSDGSVSKKVERFSKQGVERDFLKDGQKIAKIIPRLNRWNDTKNWLSIRPATLFCQGTDYRTLFGEFDEDNRPRGRGISIDKYGNIFIGYH